MDWNITFEGSPENAGESSIALDDGEIAALAEKVQTSLTAAREASHLLEVRIREMLDVGVSRDELAVRAGLSIAQIEGVFSGSPLFVIEQNSS